MSNRIKTIYRAVIRERLFFIYRFTAYGNDKLKIVKFGRAYNKEDNYTNQYQKALQKYNLLEVDTKYDLDHVINDLYLKILLNKIDFSDKLKALIKYSFEEKDKRRKELYLELKELYEQEILKQD